MYKLANQMLDAYDDVSKTFLKKLASVKPDLYMMTPEEHAELSDHDFALSVITKKAHKINKFPVNTYDNAWLSNEYFEETAQRLPKTAACTAAYHIKTACEKFSIEPRPAVVGMAKEASSNIYVEGDLPASAGVVRQKTVDMSKFAEVQQIGDNPTMAQYVMATPELVKIACAYFEEHYTKMPLDYRHKYASAIQIRAGELGMGVQKGKIEKYASDVYSAHVNSHLSSRKTLLEVADPKYRGALDKLASMKKELKPQEFARLLHGFDKRAGLEKYYGGYLVNPFEATFGSQVNPNENYHYKTASIDMTADAISKVAGEKYAKIKEYFGVHVADELKKGGVDVFESLPTDAKEIIAGIADGTL